MGMAVERTACPMMEGILSISNEWLQGRAIWI